MLKYIENFDWQVIFLDISSIDFIAVAKPRIKVFLRLFHKSTPSTVFREYQYLIN